MAWINLIQSKTAHCAKLGLVRVQNSYIDAASAQVFAPGLFGGFSFHGLKKLKGGDSWIHSTAQRKEHSKTEFEKRELWVWVWGIETFHRSKFSPATGVQSKWDFHRCCECRLVVFVFIIAENPVRFRGITMKKSEPVLTLPFLTLKVSSWQNILETLLFWKISNSHFQNFEKIDLIILANRSNRSNRKKIANRLDRFIGQGIDTAHNSYTNNLSIQVTASINLGQKMS